MAGWERRGGKGWGCFLSERGNRLSPHGHRDYACMRGGFADEWTLSGVTPAPLARGRGVCCLAGREDQFPPRDHRGSARMRGALPTNGRSPAREGPCLHEGGAFGRGWKGSSHRLDTVATPACVGALPSNGRSPACERPRFHEGGAFGRDGKGGPAFLSGRAILSEVFIGSCGGRGLSEHGREWGFGGRIRMRSGCGGMSAIRLESLPDASARAPGAGACRQ